MAPSQKTVNQQINWKQIFSLGFLNAAVVISWIAYHNYQPKVLEKFEVTDLEFFMKVAQALVLVFIPPIAGAVGDYFIRRNGNHFIVFMVGISVTAMVFMAVAFAVSGNPLENMKVILPIMIVIWLISMNIFHSPANSMLEIFAPAHQLPLAMSVLTLITELLYALEPVVVDIVDSLGATPTFVTGGLLIILSGFIFRLTTRNTELKREVDSAEDHTDHFTKIILCGLAFGLANAILMNVFPPILAEKLDFFANESLEGRQYVSMILGISAFAAIPLSPLVSRWGTKKAVLIGLAVTFMSISMISISPFSVFTMGACGLFGLAFSLLAVSSFPFVLENVSHRNVTFGAGLFFGSFELVDGLMNVFM